MKSTSPFAIVPSHPQKSPSQKRGKVYSTRECLGLAKRTHGTVGWRIIRKEPSKILVEEVFFYGKGGITEWRTRAEFEALKAFRAKEWKRGEGARIYREQHRGARCVCRTISGCYALH